MYKRYAIYYTPEGEFARLGASWLGWDLTQGRAVDHPDIVGLDVAKLTRRPRKYGLHGTIKPPFFLADGTTPGQLYDAVETLCKTLPATTLDGLEARALGGFIALIPIGNHDELAKIASKAVQSLDRFRRPPEATELARRRNANLNPAQATNLSKWGYPYVMDQFRFHVTMTGHVAGGSKQLVDAIDRHFSSHLGRQLEIGSLTLAGQDENEFFHEIERFKLSG